MNGLSLGIIRQYPLLDNKGFPIQKRDIIIGNHTSVYGGQSLVPSSRQTDCSSNDYQLFTSYFRGEEKEDEEVTTGRKARGRQERRKHDFFLKNHQQTSQ